jgi:hypothetical protein
MNPLQLPIRAAQETAIVHGVVPNRCDILQDGNTLVLRLSETLVARVVTDREGPRQGTGWFEREIDVARYLASQGAPVIPLHPDLEPGPYEHLGYPINFWKYVERIDEEPTASQIGATLYQCHHLLRSYEQPLPEFAILTESLALLETLEKKGTFSPEESGLLRDRLSSSLKVLQSFPIQALHGDAHMGNVMNTTVGLLWADWEDVFLGPVEWDLASIIWNARVLDGDESTAEGVLSAYVKAGGHFDPVALHHSMIARAAVMSTWYPVLYPNPSTDRQSKLRRRLAWLETQEGGA